MKRTAAAAIAIAFLGFSEFKRRDLTGILPLMAKKWQESVSMIN